MYIILDTFTEEYGVLTNGCITFYDESNNEYDCAFYFGPNAKIRYQVIKPIESLSEFFTFVKETN